jgi:hypothetical protein
VEKHHTKLTAMWPIDIFLCCGGVANPLAGLDEGLLPFCLPHSRLSGESL